MTELFASLIERCPERMYVRNMNEIHGSLHQEMWPTVDSAKQWAWMFCWNRIIYFRDLHVYIYSDSTT